MVWRAQKTDGWKWINKDDRKAIAKGLCLLRYRQHTPTFKSKVYVPYRVCSKFSGYNKDHCRFLVNQ